MPKSIVMHRESPATGDVNLTFRATSLSTIDEARFSVEAVVATDQMVAVLDRSSYRVIDEILLADGGSFPETVPLLDSHRNYGSADVLGGATEFRRDGGTWIGRAVFDDADEVAMKVYGKVKKRFIQSVSIGYRVMQAVEIRPGESATIGGKKYTASPNRVLRIAQKWRAFELSVTPIGADERAKFREGVEVSQKQEVIRMNPRLLAYLRRLGLAQDADEQAAAAFQRQLKGAQRTIAAALDYDESDYACRTSADLAIRSLGYDPENPWNVLAAPAAKPVQQTSSATSEQRTAPAAGDDGASLLELGRRQEQQRQNAIRALAGADVPEEVVTRALNEGWDEATASRHFLTAIREVRPAAASLTDGRGPAIHARQSDRDNDRLSLLSGFLERQSMNVVENLVVEQGGALHRPRIARDQLERAAENGYNRFRDMSMIDVLRHACQMDGIRLGEGTRQAFYDAMRSATSSSTLSYIFTSAYSAMLLASYEGSTDTTGEFTTTSILPDFKTAERTRMTKAPKLTRLAPGKEADHLTRSDFQETYKAARYAKQFFLDEQDFINDTFGAMNDTTPQEMGEAAAELRPDLVYSILLANAALSDSVALFHATHGNVATSSALNAANLESGIAGINKVTENGRILSKNGPLVLITPETLWATGARLVGSTTRYKDSDEGDMNPIRNQRITHVSDARLDNGVTDPATDTAQAGSTSTWYLARSGRHTIEVGYVRGTNNRPSVRSWIATQGRWGIGWDVSMDIGAKALDYLGLRRHTA